MKNIILYSILLLSPVLLSSCSDDNTYSIAEKDWDGTATYFEPTESKDLTTYYAPQVGYVGDPMPYYDSNDKLFKILYLQDWRDGGSTYHPIHMVVTGDLSSYENWGEAIPCGELTEQDPAMGTGSMIYANNQYYAFYTGHKDNYKSSLGQYKEVILLATSTDSKQWTKARSFRLCAPDNYDKNEFRDPYVFKGQDGLYHMTVSAIKNTLPVVAHFTSTDLKTWTVLDTPFFTDIYSASFYECTDVFKMGNYWYMVYSDKYDGKTHYRYSASIDGGWMFPVREGILDATSFYAGKTASDGNNRYIWGWCPTRPLKSNTATMDWGGALVAHKLVQNADGTLSCTVPEGIDSKYNQSLNVKQMSITEGATQSDGSYSLGKGSSVVFNRLKYKNKICFTFTSSSTTDCFGFSFVNNTDTKVKYSFRINLADSKIYYQEDKTNADSTVSTTTITSEPISLSSDNTYNIKVYSEQSVCVVYINDVVAFTNRVYGMSLNPWSLFSDKGDVSVTSPTIYTY